jgi:hypothetical protein
MGASSRVNPNSGASGRAGQGALLELHKLEDVLSAGGRLRKPELFRGVGFEESVPNFLSE